MNQENAIAEAQDLVLVARLNAKIYPLELIDVCSAAHGAGGFMMLIL